MMPHERCQQSGCWLKRCSLFSDRPLPKFCFGQRVKEEFFNEEAQELHTYEGHVIGIYPAPEYYAPGWWYMVAWDVMPMPNNDHLSIPYVDESWENDLQSVEVVNAEAN